MDVTDLLHRLLRRWIAVVVVLVLAVAAAGFGWTRASSTRQTAAAVVIVPPRLGDAVSEQNPLLNLDNNLAQLATVLAQAMQSSTVADALQQAGATASFTVSTVTGTNPSFAQLSPQIQFTVTGSEPVVTVFTATTLVSLARSQLTALQNRANVPPSARARLVESVVPTGAELVSGSRLRAAGSLGLGVVVLGLLAVLLIDAVLGRRSRPVPPRPVRARRRPDAAVDDPVVVVDDPVVVVDDAVVVVDDPVVDVDDPVALVDDPVALADTDAPDVDTVVEPQDEIVDDEVADENDVAQDEVADEAQLAQKGDKSDGGEDAPSVDPVKVNGHDARRTNGARRPKGKTTPTSTSRARTGR